MDAFLLIAVVGYFAFLVYAANAAERARQRGEDVVVTPGGELPPLGVDPRQETSPRRGVYVLLWGMVLINAFLAFMALQRIFVTEEMLESAGFIPVDPGELILAVATAALAAAFSALLITVPNARHQLALLVERIEVVARYDPLSVVHTTAAVLAMSLIAATLVLFILSGGLSAIAANLTQTGISIAEPILTALLQIGAAVLGVGYMIRRAGREMLARLGLRSPTRDDLVYGLVGGLGLFLVAIIYAQFWQLVAPQDLIEQQTIASDALAQSLNTLPLVLVASGSAAVGEEIFMRGAMQPVFGIWLTSAFFTMLHSQYLGTPTMLLILAVSVGLGFLRQRYSTTAAIIAHFVYNFIPLLLLVLLQIGSTGT
jgi:uncharacterized protein